ncbi:hypothetical protein DVH24_017666 [Malus domestica]|uniref:Uncharacterized protein n=1 Tax=Malus domestica TaxID=3750 RepID=A0A498KGU3_MALDO|nr:hypothetical protein DVH24_017666 [Malus domestica]
MAQSGFGQTTSSKQGGFIRSGLRGAQASERCGFTAGGGETMGCRRDLVAWRRCNGCDDGFLAKQSDDGASSGTSRWVWRRVLACGAARGAMSSGSNRDNILGGSVLVQQRRGMRVRQGKQRSMGAGADNEFNG